ncbi:MAG: acyltransferase [Fusobacteriaceae bacterium]
MKRNGSLDSLRVLSCFLVILLHVSAGFVIGHIKDYNFQFTVGNFFDSISRVSVPLFVMLSGSLLLENPKNKEYRFFYNKSFKKIVVPTLIWSTVYFIYSVILKYLSFKISGKIFDYITPIKDWILGKPFYHLWYLYMILWLYLITPIIIRLKEDISKKNFLRTSISLIFISIFISKYSGDKLLWVIQFIVYLGYFMIGHSLKEYSKNKSFNPVTSSIIAISSGIIVFVITEIIVKYNLLNKTLYFYGNLTPFVIIGSIFTFITFLNIKIENKKLTHLASHSFNIYLLHAGVLNTIKIFFNFILKLDYLKYNAVWFIPILTFVVFVFSYIGSLFIQNFVNKVLVFYKKIKIA